MNNNSIFLSLKNECNNLELNDIESAIDSFVKNFFEKDNRSKYPNPQMYRPFNDFINLNGKWNFCFDKKNLGEKEKYYKKIEYKSIFDKTIIVPYSYTAKDSEIEYKEECNIIWYSKYFKSEGKSRKHILNFEACDYKTKVFVNGNFVGENKGGFVPFSFDITNYLEKDENIENYIVLRVEDYTSLSQCLGKQSFKNKNFGCWYTKTYGIWQNVWIDVLEKNYIKEFYLYPNFENSKVNFKAYLNSDSSFQKNLKLCVEVLISNSIIHSSQTLVYDSEGELELSFFSKINGSKLAYWSCDDPNIYELKIRLYDENNRLIDFIDSYYGFRTVAQKRGNITINEQKIYLKMVLDQGYFSKNIMTGTKEELLKDVIKTKLMGFNGVRKHQKNRKSSFYLFL